MKPTQTLAESQNQLFASIRSLAGRMVLHTYSPYYHSDKNACAKAQQNSSNALRSYAKALVYDTYSRSDITLERNSNARYRQAHQSTYP